MNQQKLTTPEAAILYLITGLLIFGIVISRLDRYWFEFVYTVEDGFIEWMTVLALLLVFLISGRRLYTLYPHRHLPFLLSLAGLMLVCFFLIGEEVSWGQRFFNRESPDFFKAYNSQKETNLHNLIVDGKSINIIIFSRLLIIIIGSYLGILPVLYAKKQKIKTLVNSLAVPVPKLYQIISFALVFILVYFCPSGKRAELLEFSSCFLILSIVAFPKNPEIFSEPRNSNTLPD